MASSSLSATKIAKHLKIVSDCDIEISKLKEDRRELKKKIAEAEAKRSKSLKRLGSAAAGSSQVQAVGNQSENHLAEEVAQTEAENNEVNNDDSTSAFGASAGANNFALMYPSETYDLIDKTAKSKSSSKLKDQGSDSWKTPHTHKIRNIEFLGTDTDEFITNGDDGFISKWELQTLQSDRCYVAPLMQFDARSETACPFNVAVSPAAQIVVAVYRHQEKLRAYSLCSEKELAYRERLTPHKEGISEVSFMPWVNNGNPIFVTSGATGHDIACWGMFQGKWKTMAHYTEHSNLITGLCGHLEAFRVISVGRDMRVVSFDLETGESDKGKVDAECVGVGANPVDCNLLCVQTSVNGSQLRLRDMRKEDTVVATFGWKKASDTNTTLVAPAWSHSGILLTAGSGEKAVKIFDIRYHKEQEPLSVEDRGAVFRVAWAPSTSVLLSTGGRKITVHRVTGADVLGL